VPASFSALLAYPVTPPGSGMPALLEALRDVLEPYHPLTSWDERQGQLRLLLTVHADTAEDALTAAREVAETALTWYTAHTGPMAAAEVRSWDTWWPET
jgi:hypothetical protein